MTAPEFRAPSDFRTRVNLVIAEVWQEPDPKNTGWFLTKYRLEDDSGAAIGTFHTPTSSRLSKTLIEHMQRKRQ